MLELLVAFRGVRPSPGPPANGILGLVQFDEYDYYLEWRDESTLSDDEVGGYVACAQATEGDDTDSVKSGRPFVISSMQNAISFAFITGLIGDDLSMTLLATVRDGPPKLYLSSIHPPTTIVQSIGVFVQGGVVEPVKHGVSYMKMPSPPQSSSMLSLASFGESDWKESVLERFSRVTTFYADTAQKIISAGRGLIEGSGDLYSDTGRYVENPWIERKSATIPNSRFTNRLIDESILEKFTNVDGTLKNHENLFLLCHCGTVSEKLRKKLWLYFLKIRGPDMADQDFDNHCEYLKSEYEKIKSEYAVPSEETISRIGIFF
jgi:hypothetical protein